MYAVIEVGAKQYNVKKDDVIDIERQDISNGKEMTINKVLLVSKDKKVEVGQPYLKGAHVVAVVVDDDAKGKKVVTYKYERRKAYHRTIGHRQKYTRIKIKEIGLGN